MTASPSRGSLRGWQPRSGGIGARALNPITAGPLPATLLGPLCVSSQPMCSSEHPTKTPGPIGLSPPSSEGRSGLVHPGTDDRQAASSTEYYYTSRSYTYEQKQQERALTWRCVPSTTGMPRICVPFWIRTGFEAHHAFPGALSTSIRKSENGPRASQANVLRSEVYGMPRSISTIAKTFWVNGRPS